MSDTPASPETPAAPELPKTSADQQEIARLDAHEVAALLVATAQTLGKLGDMVGRKKAIRSMFGASKPVVRTLALVTA